MGRVPGEMRQAMPIKRQPDMSRGKSGIELARLLIKFPGQFHGIRSDLGLQCLAFR